MLEISTMFVLMFLFAVWLFAPSSRIMLFFSKLIQQIEPINEPLSTNTSGVELPEDSVLKRHVLTQIQTEIESNLFPRPTDSVLQRHYDALVATEIEDCLGATT